MNIIIDIIYYIVAFVAVYFMFLFLLLFIAHRKKLSNVPTMKKFPSLSIIIPAYNEEKTIGKTIKAVKNLLYPKKFEIIVVNDSSTDKTCSIAKKFKDVKVISKQKGGKASALNLGLKYAKGEIVACIDSDSYPERHALLRAVGFFEKKNVASVTASIFVKNPRTIIQRLQQIEYVITAWNRKLLQYLNSIYVTPGPMSLYRKDVLIKVGGFDEENLTEDIEIAWRLMRYRYKIRMSLDSNIYTTVPKTLKEWWHQRTRWSIGGLQTTSKYFHLFLNRSFSNLGMFLLPFFSVSYVLSILGLFLLSYIIFDWLIGFVYFIIAYYKFGFGISGFMTFSFMPDIFLVLGIFTFLLSVVYLRVNLTTMKRPIKYRRRAKELLIYLSVYGVIYPFNLIYSFFKFLLKKYEW